MISKIKHYFGRRYNVIKLLFDEYKLVLIHLGSNQRWKNQNKYKSYLIMKMHVIEKGLSFRSVKVGFGEQRVLELLDELYKYYQAYSDIDFSEYILKPIDEYIKFNNRNAHFNSEILSKYNKCIDIIGADLTKVKGGAAEVTKEEIYSKALINFEDFLNTRYSIRDFSDKPINPDLIWKALSLATRTPSACNRQPWHAHVFLSKASVSKILEFQTGSRQFNENIGCAILVTSSYNSFFGGEYHQPYVNGALYAMTLIYSLHSLGLGTIPLNMGFGYKKLKELKYICKIKSDEVPVLLIGVGNLPDRLRVAQSVRFSYEQYINIY
jgi:nitroreductase